MLRYAIFVALGAVVGSILRWKIGGFCNSFISYFVLGTLLVNLIGSYLIGLVIPLGNHYVTLSPEIKLFFITGFLGSFTTFSTFSAEVTQLIFHRQYFLGLGIMLLHVGGSVIMTFLGVLTMKGVLFNR